MTFFTEGGPHKTVAKSSCSTQDYYFLSFFSIPKKVVTVLQLCMFLHNREVFSIL
jgi:hypothetical protein